jgi:hypothetical protein
MKVPNELQLDSGSYLLYALLYESNTIARHDRSSAAYFLHTFKSEVQIACQIAAWLGLATPAVESPLGWTSTPPLVDLVVQQRRGHRRDGKKHFSGVETTDFDTIAESALGDPFSLEREYCVRQCFVFIGLIQLGDDEDEWVPTQRLLDLVAEKRKERGQAGDEADEDDLAG